MKGHKLSTSTFVAIVVLVLSVICMFFLLNYSAKSRKARTNNFNEVTEAITTTTSVEDITTDKLPEETPVDQPEEVIAATNFKASLADILYNNPLDFNYNISTKFNGAKFTFTCSEYNEETSTCVKGSAIMNTGSAVLPLYSFENDDQNYYKRQFDYYIELNDKYIIITTSHTGKTPGESKFYDKQGNFLTGVSNVVTGFYIENQCV